MSTATASAVRLDDAALASSLPIADDAAASFRAAARERLAAGLPGRKNEDWKYTSLKHLAGPAFAAAPESGDASAATRDVLAGLDESGPCIVIVDGRIVPEASRLDGLPEGVALRPMSELAQSGGDLVARLGTANESWNGGFFEDLNAAAFTEGLVLHVPRNVVVETPIVVRIVDTGGAGAARLLCPRSLVVAEESSSATIVEDHVGLDDDAPTLLVSMVEVLVGPNARVRHLRVGREGRATTAVPMIRARLDRDAHFESHVLLFGGRVVRNEVNPVLAGPNAGCVLNGLLVPTGEQHVDNHMRIEHRVPDCYSRQFYKSILNDRSVGAFTGRIVVSDDASRTDAVQSAESLIMDAGARAITRPQLEIYDYDVKCTHGATTGQLDRDGLFYLESRGIPRAQARGLLVFAFASEVLERFGIDAVERAASAGLRARLPFARGIEELD